MATTLQIVDPLDQSTVLFDLNDPTGANSGEYGGVRTDLLSTVSFGAAPWQFDRLEPPGIQGGVTTFQRAGLREMTVPVRIRGAVASPTYDNLTLGLGYLSNLLANGCVMKWIANGSSLTRYIDVEPSPSPVLLAGQESAMYLATQLFDTPEGVTLSLTVQPFLRGDALTPSVNLLTNATMLRDSNNDGTPDGWTFLNGTLTIQAAQEAVQIVDNASNDKMYQEPSLSAGTVVTASFDARKISGDRTVNIQLISRPGGTVVATQAITATTWARYQITGTVAGGDTSMRLKVAYASGSNSTTMQWRNAQLESGTATATPFRVKAETVSTDPTASGMATMMPVYNPSEAPAPCVFTLAAPDASSAITQVDMARRSSKRTTGAGKLADLLNGPFYAPGDATGNGWTVALSNGATDAGTYANVAPTSSILQRRIKWTRTAQLDALRGEHDVWARVRHTTPTLSSLTSGGSTTDATSFTTASVTLTADRLYVIYVAWQPDTVTLNSMAPTGGVGGTTTELVYEDNVNQLAMSTRYIVPTATVTDTMTISFSSTATAIRWAIVECAGLNLDYAGQVAPGIVQVVESEGNSSSPGTSTPLATFGSAQHWALTGFSHEGNTAVTPSGDFTELSDGSVATPATGLEVAYKTSEDTAWTFSLGVSEQWIGAHLELATTGVNGNTYQLRWSPNDQTPQAIALGGVVHDRPADPPTMGWHMKRLGRISLPEDPAVTLGTLALELWSQSTAEPSGVFDIDHLLLVPTDEQAMLSVAEGSPFVWRGTQLESPVSSPAGGTAALELTDSDGIVQRYMDTTTDNVGTSPNTGTDFDDGSHIATWVLAYGDIPPATVEIIVRNVTDSTYTFRETVTLAYGSVYTLQRAWTAAAGKLYQLQVDNPSDVPFQVYEMRDEFLRSVVQNEKMRADPGSKPGRYTAERLTSTDTLSGPLDATNVPFVLPPGLSLVTFMVGDVPQSGFEEPTSADSRTITVSPTVHPRYPL